MLVFLTTPCLLQYIFVTPISGTSIVFKLSLVLTIKSLAIHKRTISKPKGVALRIVFCFIKVSNNTLFTKIIIPKCDLLITTLFSWSESEKAVVITPLPKGGGMFGIPLSYDVRVTLINVWLMRIHHKLLPWFL